MFLCLPWMTPMLQRAFNSLSNLLGENTFAQVSTRLSWSCIFFFLFVGKISYKQVLVQVTEKRAESILREMKFIHTNVLKCSFWTVSLHLVVSKKPLSENFPGREILSPHFLVNIANTVAAPSSSWITLKQSPQQSHRVLGIQWCPGHITLGCSTGITSW